MQPQLIVQDFGGSHNGNLDQTRARLIKGASWKKQNVIVLLPAADTIPSKVCLALWNLIFPPNNGVVKILALGQEVGEAYSNAIEQCLADPGLSKFQYVLAVEHDNLPPADGVIKLIEDLENHPDLGAVGGLYFTQGPGGVPQIWGDPTDPVINYRPQIPNPAGGLQECNGLGMGFTLYRMSMLADPRIERPLFKTTKSKEEGTGTQDLVFCRKAKVLGYKFAVNLDVRVGHYDLTGERGGIPDFVW